MEIENRDDAQPEVHDDEPRVDLPGADVGLGYQASQVETDSATSATPAEVAAEDVEQTEPVAEPETIQLNLGPLITLVIGLGLGFLAGFAGRPYLMSQSQPSVALTQEGVAQPSAAATPASAAQPAAPTSAPATSSNAATDDTASREAAAQRVMDVLIAQTRHFKGDPNAPVTIIEFSDFQ